MKRVDRPRGWQGAARAAMAVLGVIIALISLLFVAMAIGDLAGGNAYESEPGVVWALLFFFLATGACGCWMAWRNSRRVRAGAPESADELEQRILAVARSLNGRVTVLEVAARCGVSIEDAKDALSAMSRQGVIEPALTDDGVMLYTFSGFLSSRGRE